VTVTYRRSLSCGMAGLTISSSLRWVAPLMAGLGVLDDEDHGQGQGYHGLEYRFPTGGNPATMLTMIHVAAAVTTMIAARGRDAYRSTLDSHRLTRDLDSSRVGAGFAMEPGIRCYFSPSFRASSSRPIFDLPGRSRFRAIS
jgi:hypothetical protein